jgi:hypothetical protein
MGRKGPTSYPLGLIMPTVAAMRSNTTLSVAAKRMPAATMSTTDRKPYANRRNPLVARSRRLSRDRPRFFTLIKDAPLYLKAPSDLPCLTISVQYAYNAS